MVDAIYEKSLLRSLAKPETCQQKTAKMQIRDEHEIS